MIVTCREDLNDMLWEDYLNHREENQSFIYHYTRKKKDSWAEIIARSRESLEAYEKTARRDKYTLLRSAYLAYCGGVISEEEYLKIFRDAVRVSVKPTREQRQEKEKTGKVFPMKAAGKYAGIHGREAIDAAQKQWEKALLKGTISDFFRNLGYKVPKDGVYGWEEDRVRRGGLEREAGAANRKGPEREAGTAIRNGLEREEKEVQEGAEGGIQVRKTQKKFGKMQHVYGDDFDLLYQFQIYMGENGGMSDSRTPDSFDRAYPEEAHIQKCEELFRQLNEERMTDIIVPLFCDSRSGAGVYLIGMDEIEEQKILTEGLTNPGSCVPCIIYYSDASSVDMDQMTFEMTVESFNTVRQAFEQYRRKAVKGAFFENYAMGNEDRGYGEAPEGADPLFCPFFQNTGNRRREIIRQEAQAEREERELRERRSSRRTQAMARGKRYS